MQLTVPFYENIGSSDQSVQVAMQSIIKYFLDKEMPLETIDHLTNKSDDIWTWTVQAAVVLHEFGLDVHYYSTADMQLLLEDDKKIEEVYGDREDNLLAYTDLEAVRTAVKKLLDADIYTQEACAFSKIEKALDEGAIPLVLIDYNPIIGRDATLDRYFVPLTGYDKRQVSFHESGPVSPQANKLTSKATFMEAWKAEGTDQDLIIVSGKR